MPFRVSLISFGDRIASVSSIFCDMHYEVSFMDLEIRGHLLFPSQKGNRSIVLIDKAIGLRLGERETACQNSFF